MKITNKSVRPKFRLAIFSFLIRLFFSDAYHLCKRHGKKEKTKLNQSTNTGKPTVWESYHPKGKERVLLREAETCGVCGEVYLSLYPLRMCSDHEGLQYVGKKKEVV